MITPNRRRGVWLAAAVVVVFLVFVVRLTSSAGELVIDPLTVDWGQRVRGDLVPISFRMVNRGSETCRVSVQPSCSCSAVTGVPSSIAPGQVVVAVMTVDTSAYVGPLQTALLFVHDGRNGPTAKLRAYGSVVNGFTLAPPRWSVPEMPVANARLDPPHLSAILETDAAVDLRHAAVSEPLDLLALRWDEKSSRDRRVLHIALKRPFPVGFFATVVRVTVGTVTRECVVQGRFEGPIEVSHERLRFRRSGDDCSTRTVSLSTPVGSLDSVEIVRCPKPVRAACVRVNSLSYAVPIGLAPENVGASGGAVVVMKVLHRADETASPLAYRVLVRVRWDSLSLYEHAGE